MRHLINSLKAWVGIFQSTHPSGVRLSRSGQGGRGQLISIHAPQWGAARRVCRCRAAIGNFNPRTPVGCDQVDTRRRATRYHFNPRTPVGCDTRQAHRSHHRRISIHAPQWGATGWNCRYARTTARFQSTHPSGVRRLSIVLETPPSHFNPRTPVGCDDRNITSIINNLGFQSTHPSGVRRRIPAGDYQRGHDFNPRTPVGCDDPPSWRWNPLQSNFNPRTPVGCDDSRQYSNPSSTSKFQSTHPSGVRRPRRQDRFRREGYFNPRTPVGCDDHTISPTCWAHHRNPRTPVGCDDRENGHSIP